MSRTEPPVEEERNSFKPVNDYIDHLLDRQHDLLIYRRFRRWRALAIGVALLAIAMGCAYVLYSWGGYIQKKKPPVEVIMKDIYIPETAPHANKKNKATVSYTVFQTISISESRRVVTGYNYEPDKTEFPRDQYCYVSFSSNDIKHENYYVARKAGTRSVNWNSEVSADLFQLGQEYCRFKSAG